MGLLAEKCSGANLGQCANSGSSALVSMMKPAFFGKRKDLSHLRRLRGPAIPRILPERKLASRNVVIIKIRNQMALERNLIQDDDMVEAFPADQSRPTVRRTGSAREIGKR